MAAALSYLVLFWMIPMTVVQSFTNFQKLADTFSWLEPLLDIPSNIRAAIEGLLPSIIMIIFMSLVPKICLLLARVKQHKKHSERECSFMVSFKHCC